MKIPGQFSTEINSGQVKPLSIHGSNDEIGAPFPVRPPSIRENGMADLEMKIEQDPAAPYVEDIYVLSEALKDILIQLEQTEAISRLLAA